MTQKTIYLIDGTAYIHRAYHAIQGLSNAKGVPTNAAFGFARMLVKLLEEKKPEYIGMFFDAKGPTFRHQIYDQYKANRPPMPPDMAVQIPYIRQITEAYRIPVMELSGYEADDLIGAAARRAEVEGFFVVMVTGDKDFIQLVTDNAVIWDPMKEKTTDMADVRERFGVAPAQMVDVLGLWGDASDNIPGVPGVGQKTALDLVRTFGGMDGVYAGIDAIRKKKQKENLIAFREQAFLSRKLAEIRTDVPISVDLDDFRIGEPDVAALSALYRELEFRQLYQSLSAGTETVRKNYTGVFDADALAALAERLSSADLIAVDTETTSEKPMRAELVGLSFAVVPHEAFYIPCGHIGLDAPEQLDLDDALDALKPILENPAVKKIGQNIKYDWIVLARHGVSLDGVIGDTMLASYLLNPSKRAHNLDQIAMDFLGHKTISYEEVAGKGKNAAGFEAVPVEKAVPYACEDADVALLAHRKLDPMIREAGLSDLLNDIETPLIPVLARMEMNGVRVDKDRLRDLSKSFEHQIQLLEDRIYALAGERFNVKSSQQLGAILFEKLKLPVQKKTRKKTGYSTDVEVLSFLADRHELPALVLRHRTLAKLKSTYADALIDLVHPETGRIHTSYNQTVTATGRLSSSDPNLQNIPVRDEEGKAIRRAFIPREGWRFVSADYSQIELRILAHYSEDDILMASFLEDEDIHARTAAEVFQTIPDMVTPELRRQAKAINFGIIYGMSPFGLSKELNISQKMAKAYIGNYFKTYKGVKAFIDRTIDEAGKTRRSSTLFGRIRFLPDINSDNRNLRSAAERTAVNTPIQGTAADLIKLAMIRVDAAFRKQGLQSAMLLSVHDELVFESPPGETETVKALVRDILENVRPLKVPLKVNVADGKDWTEAH